RYRPFLRLAGRQCVIPLAIPHAAPAKKLQEMKLALHLISNTGVDRGYLKTAATKPLFRQNFGHPYGSHTKISTSVGKIYLSVHSLKGTQCLVKTRFSHCPCCLPAPASCRTCKLIRRPKKPNKWACRCPRPCSCWALPTSTKWPMPSRPSV